MKLDSRIEQELAAIAGGEGLELLAVEITGSGPRTVVRLVVDSSNGIDLDHCAAVSRQASAMLDVEDPIAHHYTLEVSSPGLDRKLYSGADYGRFAGRRVKVRMQPSFRDHRVVVGELLGLSDGVVRLRTDADGDVELPEAEIFETRLEVDWDQIMKEGKHRP